MSYILYILGVIVWSLSLCYLILVTKTDEENLPLPKDAIMQIIVTLIMVGAIFLGVSNMFKGIQGKINENQIKTNRTFLK